LLCPPALSPPYPFLSPSLARLTSEKLAAAKVLNDKGGDWDRRNRLKVYEGVLAVQSRDFKRASELLLDSVSTFTASELLSYEQFMFYVALVSLKCLERPLLKKKVIDSPDVIAVLTSAPDVSTLLSSFYEGRYSEFLAALVRCQPQLQRDRLLSTHAPWFLWEMRIAAYAQFLESYKSVTLSGMARAFGVSVPFLDQELARLIASGRISAKIDAIKGIIESARADAKNAQYMALIKQGDALLNKVQALNRVVAL